VLYGLLAAGCADVPSEDAGTYVVKPQDTLYSIAWRHGLDYRDVARWNHIGADFRIVVGQTLLLHGAARSGNPVQAPPHAAAPRVAAATPAAPPSALQWVWPTERTRAPQQVPGGGILMPGRFGQEIRAACAGRVVYVGNGIRGYGNLIIVKHGENLLSAYAHNRDVQVQESEEVAAGQIIGHMGEGTPGKPVLYFEIRRSGKPVDAIQFMPKID
jgi:lipoprotein NlpD